MVRAAAEGLIDYSTCDPYDPRWWRRHWLLLDELDARTHVELLDREQQYLASILAAAETPRDMIKTLAQQMLTGINNWTTLRAPWLELAALKDVKSADQLLEEEIGKPGDPRYEEIMRETEALLATPIEPAKLDVGGW